LHKSLLMEIKGKSDRRSFLQKTGVVLLAGTLAMDLANPKRAYASKNGTLKVGLIGCGGRGTGAAAQALLADADTIITAMGDVFPEQIEQSYNALLAEHPDRIKVNAQSRYTGFDAYKKVIASGVDIVLLATPPVFRPEHFMEAVNAGKHVFCEKPVAIDAPGVRKVLAAARKAKEKNLAVVSGFCFRYDLPKRAFYEKISAGQIGEVVTVSTTRNGGELWYKSRQPEWTDMEYKLKNWLYYSWLSGDFISEMMVHSLDLMSWAVGDRLPVKATGTGGRQVRVDEKYGNVFDHFAIEFEYPNGVKGYHFSRQQEGCSNANTVSVAGTHGSAFIDNGRGIHTVTGKNKWEYKGEKNNMYETQHQELFASIRNGKPLNDGEKMANSSMLGVLGRMVAYTGQSLTWEEALNSNETLGPPIDQYSRDLKWTGNNIAKPGITKFS
jgi:myo-inositol 2-dehydrogenase/D-chiro-inositol 1-dehydrogenase